MSEFVEWLNILAPGTRMVLILWFTLSVVAFLWSVGAMFHDHDDRYRRR